MIKLGTPDNINSLVILGEEWAAELEIPEFDSDRWLSSVRMYSILSDHYCSVFYDNLNKPQGFVMGCFSLLPHTISGIGQLHYIYLRPNFLSDDNLYELHSSFVTWLQDFKPSRILAPDVYDIPDTYQSFLENIGYEPGYTTQFKGM